MKYLQNHLQRLMLSKSSEFNLHFKIKRSSIKVGLRINYLKLIIVNLRLVVLFDRGVTRIS